MADFADRTIAQIRRAFHFTFNFWRCGMYGTDAGTATVVKVDTDGELYVNVMGGTGGGNAEQTLGTDSYVEGTSVGNAIGAVRNDGAATIFVDQNLEFCPIATDRTGQPWVRATELIPGVAATNLGKAIDSVVGATDTGVAMLGKHLEDQTLRVTADDDYDVFSMDSLGSMHVNAEAHHIFDEMDVLTGWLESTDATGTIATTSKHVLGSDAITFDKSGVTVTEGSIFKSLTTVDLGTVSPHDILQAVCYVPDISDIDYVFLRLGSSATDYNEWRIAGENLTAGEFELLAFIVGDASHAGITGVGWNPNNVAWGSVGVVLLLAADTLTGIIFDEISYHTNQHTATSINAEVTSSVSSPNVKVNGWRGSVSTNSGTVDAGTLRVVLPTDQPAVAVTATGLPLPAGAATLAAQLPDGHAVILSTNDGVDIGNVDVASVPADPFGVNADPIGAAGAAGSMQAKLRRLTNDLSLVETNTDSLTVVGAGAGTTAQRVILATNDGVDIGNVDVASTPEGVALTYNGIVDATTLSSDTTWTKLVTNTSSDKAKKIIIRNWSDKTLEVAYNDAPTDTTGTDIDDYITPFTVYEIDLKPGEMYIDTDIEVRRYDGTPSLGDVSGVIFYV